MEPAMPRKVCGCPRAGFFAPQRLCLSAGRLLLLSVLAIFIVSAASAARAEDSRRAQAFAKSPKQHLSSVRLCIHRPGSHLDPARFEKIARALIALKAGDPFSETNLKQALQRLKDSRVFERIAVDSEAGGSGPVALTFDLVPFRLTQRVDIKGAFPLFRDEVTAALGLRSGDIFTDDRLALGKKRLMKLLEAQGFIDPALDLNVHAEAADGNVALTVKISKRGYYRLRKVTIAGNQYFSDSAIRARMATWRDSFWPGGTGRFLTKNLKRDIRNLLNRYRSNGFASVVVKHHVVKNDVSGDVTIVLDIQEGPRYDVIFEGNRNFSNRELKKELILFKKGYRHGFSLRRSIRHIRQKYRRAGFARVRVTPEVQDKNDTGGKIRQIRIIIDEGAVESVSALHFNGNLSIDEKTLKKQMLSVADHGKKKRGFSPEVLKKDVQAIEALYRYKGFAKARIKADVTRQAATHTVDIAIHIDEGIFTKVASVDITGLPAEIPDDFHDRLQVRIQEPFRRDLMAKDEALISALVSKNGYPYVKVTGGVVYDRGGGAVHVAYRVAPGARTRLSAVFIRGNFKTRPGVILNALEFKTGDLFSLQKMLVSQSKLRNLEIFQSVRMQPVGLKEKDRDIVLVVNVGERKPYFVEMGAGYDTQRGIFGLLTGGNLNLWGSNILSRIHLFASQIGYGGDLTARKPNVLGTQFSANGRLFGEHRKEFNQSFGTESYGAVIGVSGGERHDFTFGVKAGYQRRKQFQVDDFPIKSSDLDLRNVADTVVFLQYDTRDSFLRPKKGIYSRADVSFFRGFDNDLDDFFKYRLDARYYWTPLSRLTLATAARGGYIDIYGGSASLADDQLFFLGGAADVRGFSENLLRRDPAGKAVGGRTMLSGTLEARIDIGHSFELVTFLDTGMIGHPSDPDSQGGLRFTTGLGLNYVTPIGPIGFSYGFNLDPRAGEEFGRFNFSIGYTF